MICMNCAEKFPATQITKLKNFSLELCSSCTQELLYKVNGENVAFIYVGKDDIEQAFSLMDDDKVKKLKKLLGEIDRNKADEIARDMGEIMSDGFWEEYHDIMVDSIEDMAKRKEYDIIEKLPRDELPLHINDDLYEASKKLLEQRLKGK